MTLPLVDSFYEAEEKCLVSGVWPRSEANSAEMELLLDIQSSSSFISTCCTSKSFRYQPIEHLTVTKKTISFWSYMDPGSHLKIGLPYISASCHFRASIIDRFWCQDSVFFDLKNDISILSDGMCLLLG